MFKLADLEKAKPYRQWLISEAVKTDMNRHITNAVLDKAKSLETMMGIEKRGDYDVQQNRPGSGRSRSGLFR